MTGAVDCAEVASRWSCSGKADAAAVNDGGREYGVTGSSKTWVEGGRASSSNSCDSMSEPLCCPYNLCQALRPCHTVKAPMSVAMMPKAMVAMVCVAADAIGGVMFGQQYLLSD